MKIGEVLGGRYRIEEPLGEGRIGCVFRATDLTEEIPVAIKVPHPRHAQSPEVSSRFRRELLTGMRLAHPGIVACLDTGEHRGHPYLVNELVDGPSILAWFDQVGRDFEMLAEVLDHLLEALAYAHVNRVVHRELKPANLLIGRDNRPRLLDFGLAGRLEDQLRQGTTADELALTYLSPEQAMGERGDERSDIYSLGSILYHLVAGRPLFDYARPADLLLAQLNEAPTPLSSLQTNVPVWFDRLVLRMLAKPPDRRPQTALEVQTWIRRRRLPGPAPLVRPDPMLGRDAELKVLEEALAGVRQGKGTAVRISGPPGIGKTRLLDALAEVATAAAVPVVRIAPRAHQELHLGVVASQLGKGFGTAAERLEERTLEGPLVVLMDAVNRADAGVANLLDELLAGLSGLPLLLVTADRPAEINLPLVKATLERLTQHLELKGLPSRACSRLIEDKLWATPGSDAISWFERTTGGNPYFLKLLLDRLEGRHLMVAGGQVSFTPPPPQEVPDDLLGLLSSVLDREGQETADLLALAATLGEWFEYNLLKAVVLIEESMLESMLERLVRTSFLREEWDSGVIAYRFAHPLLYQVALARISPRRRRRVHLLAAAFLDRARSAPPETICRHFEGACEYEKALESAAHAMAASLDRENYGEARYWLKRCQALGSQVREELRADLIFGPAWQNFGWAGTAEDTGLRHFLAAQYICLGHGEGAIWQLQISLEQGLEDDPLRQVENLLLRAMAHLKGLGLDREQVAAELELANQICDRNRFEDRMTLTAALRSRLEETISP